MKIRGVYILLSLLPVTAGCQLNSAPKCVPDDEKCQISDLLGTGVYYTCDDDGEWVPVMGCLSCNNDKCDNDAAFITCENEGETQCVEESGYSVQFTCNQNRWSPLLCGNGCHSNTCASSPKSCDNDQTQCVWIDSMNYAIQAICQNNQWKSFFCPENVRCDADKCASTPEPTLSCDDGFADCNHDTKDGCETNLNLLHMKSCFDCMDHYGNCDNNLNNGCETDLKAAGLSECNKCKDSECFYDNTCTDAMTTTEACGSSCTNCLQQNKVKTAKCENGSCITLTCQDNLTVCQNTCVDLKNNPNHCGKCETACKTDEICNAGNCESTTSIHCVPPETITTKTVTIKTVSGTKTVTATAIKSISELKCLSDPDGEGKSLVNPDNAYYLTSDITIPLKSWEPIDTSKDFTGVFDGNNHTIKAVNAMETSNALTFTLFQSIQNAYIGNINLDISLNISGTDSQQYAVLANNSKNSYIENITGRISIKDPNASSSVNGLVRKAYGTKISNCNIEIDLDIPGSYDVGGIAGSLYDSSSITDTKVTGTIIANTVIGGIAGYVSESDITNCTFDGNITALNNNHTEYGVGGIAGFVDGGHTISNCSSSGTLKTSYINGGGLAGTVHWGNVVNCHSSMDVSGYSALGGLIGFSGADVTNSYATGNVTSDQYSSNIENPKGIGGFIGHINYPGEITNCYSTGNVTATGNHGIIAGGFVGTITPPGSVEIKKSGAFGNVSSDAITGGFVGEIGYVYSDTHFIFDQCYAAGQISSSTYMGGFAGNLRCFGNCDTSDYTFTNDYSLYTPKSSLSSSGGFIGKVDNTVQTSSKMNSCYFNKNFTSAIGSGTEYITAISTSDVYFDSSNIPRIDETTTLSNKLGTEWKEYKCTIDLGNGSKIYQIPISSSIYPAFCTP